MIRSGIHGSDATSGIRKEISDNYGIIHAGGSKGKTELGLCLQFGIRPRIPFLLLSSCFFLIVWYNEFSAFFLYLLRRRISIRGRVSSPVGPSFRRSVRLSVCPVLLSKVKARILGASCAVYPALFFLFFIFTLPYVFFIPFLFFSYYFFFSFPPSIFHIFRCAVASLYEGVSVRMSVRPSVGPSVGPWVR